VSATFASGQVRILLDKRVGVVVGFELTAGVVRSAWALHRSGGDVWSLKLFDARLREIERPEFVCSHRTLEQMQAAAEERKRRGQPPNPAPERPVAQEPAAQVARPVPAEAPSAPPATGSKPRGCASRRQARGEAIDEGDAPEDIDTFLDDDAVALAHFTAAYAGGTRPRGS
jgi:hypothetical protein